MNAKKSMISGFLIVLFLALTVLSGCRGKDIQSEKVLNEFSKLMNYDDLSLTIYYDRPYTCIRIPMSVDRLIHFADVKKIVMSGSDLKEDLDLFEQLTRDNVISVKKKSHVDAHIYYYFESEKEGKILDVALWGNNSSVFINGLEFKKNHIFYDFVQPYLTFDAEIE